MRAAESARWQRVVVIVVSMYLIMVANGGMLLLVVGLKQVAADFDWPRSVPSLAYAFLFIGTGLGGIAMGHWFDRSGAVPVVMLGTVMIGAGALLGSRVEQQWQLYFIYGVMMGLLGHAAIYGPLVLNVMGWFRHRRGFAIGLITAGQGLGGVLWPLVFQSLNETAGWRQSFFWFGIFVLVTTVPLVFVLGRDPPASQEPTSRPRSSAMDRSRAAPVLSINPAGIQLLLCVAIVGCCVSMSMPLAHLVSHASDLGHAAARGAELLALALLSATLVRLTCGTLIVDRLGGLAALLIFSGLQAASLGLYALVDGITALYLVSVVFGLGYGGISMCYPLIVRDHLPASQSGRRLGTVLLFGALGMALGGWLAGYVFDLTGSYSPAFLIGLGFNVVNLILVVLLLSGGHRPAPEVIEAT